MYFEKGHLYHVYNQGNNRERIFFQSKNDHFFIKKFRREMYQYLDILAYCLMPNHFHFMVHVKSSDIPQDKYNSIIVKNFATVLRSYTRAINVQENRTGSLFRTKTKSKSLVENESTKYIKGSPPSRNNYAYYCFHYIHRNPVKAGLVKRMEDWEFSSFRDFAGLRDDTFCNKQLAFEIVKLTSDNFYDDSYRWIDNSDFDVW